MLDELIDVVGDIKGVNKKIGKKAEEQGKKYDSLNATMDNTERKLGRTKNNMIEYLNRTSNCKIYIIIGIELLIFVVLMSI